MADVVNAYLQDLSRTPRFTREEEHALWGRMKAGEAARQRLIDPCPLPVARMVLLRTAILQGDDAFSLLSQSVRAWAFSIVKGIIRWDLATATSLADEAVLKAVQKFDPRLGRLVTYVAFWALQLAKKYRTCQRSVIRVPPKPPKQYAAEAAQASDIQSLSYRARDDYDTLDAMLPGVENDNPLQNLLDAEEIATEVERLAHFRRLIAELPPRMRAVLRWRLQGRTLQQIADWLGMSREGIRQIEARSIRVLRRWADLNPLPMRALLPGEVPPPLVQPKLYWSDRPGFVSPKVSSRRAESA